MRAMSISSNSVSSGSAGLGPGSILLAAPYNGKKCECPFEIEATLQKDEALHVRYINTVHNHD